MTTMSDAPAPATAVQGVPEATPEAAAPEQDFAVDEATLPTQETVSDFGWVKDKYKNDAGEFDADKLSEGYANLHKKMSDKGMLAPESVDGYEINLGENNPFDDEALSGVKEAFKEMELPAQFAQPLMEAYAKELEQVQTMVKEQLEQGGNFDARDTTATLKEAWGKDFDANLQDANRAISQFYDGDITAHLSLANNPEFAKFAAAVGRELREDSAAQPTPSRPAVTREEYEAIMNSPSYWDKMADQNSLEYQKVQAYLKSNG
jgi:hypothetical protein